MPTINDMDLDAVMRQLGGAMGGAARPPIDPGFGVQAAPRGIDPGFGVQAAPRSIDPGFYRSGPSPGEQQFGPAVPMPRPPGPWGDKNLDPGFYKDVPPGMLTGPADDRAIAEQMLKQIGPPVYSPGRATTGPSEMVDQLNAMGRLGSPR